MTIEVAAYLQVTTAWETGWKPNSPRIAITSVPDSVRILDIRRRLPSPWWRGSWDCLRIQDCQVFTLEVEPDGLSNVDGQLIQGGRLGNDWQIEALSHKLGLSGLLLIRT